MTGRGLVHSLTLLGLLLSLGAGAAGCAQEAHSSPQVVTAHEAPALRVRTASVALSSLTETLELRGVVLADRDVTFSAEMPGRIESMSVDNGDRVRRGQVLARIDYRMQRAQREQAAAARDLAVATLERLQALRAEDMASAQQIDQAEAQARNAKAALAIADAQLAKAVVTSSIDGVVARRFLSEGEYANPGQPVVQVVDLSRVRVSAQVPESGAARVRRGMPVRMRIDALGRALEGTVHVLMPATFSKSNTFDLRVLVDNPDYSILAGMAVTLQLDAQEHREVVVVQQDVVVESESGRSVYVAQEGVARRRAVALGPIAGDRVVVTEGLQPGDQLIIEGQRSLHDGQKVEIVTGHAAAAAAPHGDETRGS